MPNKIIKKTNQIVENQNENSIHYAMLLFTQLQMTLNTPNNQRKEKKTKMQSMRFNSTNFKRFQCTYELFEIDLSLARSGDVWILAVFGTIINLRPATYAIDCGAVRSISFVVAWFRVAALSECALAVAAAVGLFIAFVRVTFFIERSGISNDCSDEIAFGIFVSFWWTFDDGGVTISVICMGGNVAEAIAAVDGDADATTAAAATAAAAAACLFCAASIFSRLQC